ncbi:MAG: PilN domain-containing protein [Candidatus Riflebacteria bacterium]|nr:PilN domain-containing protein [Candidatus Riflebacteria bacterium]
MVKRFIVVFLFVGLVFPGFVLAENSQKETAAAGEQIFTGRAEYRNLRMCLDFVADLMAKLDLKYNEARVSPMVMAEHWYEFPIELGWLGTQDTVVPLFERLLAYSFAESRLANWAIAISCSAETSDDGQPFLSISAQEKLVCLGGAERDWKGSPAEMWASIFKRNQKIVRAIKSMLELTTFTPQVCKKIQGGVVVGQIGQRKTWITNLRLDSDDRIQLTGYSLDPKQVTLFGEELLRSGSFVEVYLSSMTKNVYEKVPVWRFDITARAN